VTPRVVFLDDYQGAAEHLASLGRLGAADVVVQRRHLVGAELVAALAGADVVVAMRERTRFDRALFSALPDLKLLCTTGPANAAIDLAAATDHGVTVTATEGRASGNTAELTWALILAVRRHLPAEVASVAAGGWQTSIGTDLAGSTLGLAGLGRIGARVARVGAAFGMEVIAWSQHLDPERARRLDVVAVSKAELLARADVLSVHLVLSPRTRGLFAAAELRAMRPTAIIVNTSRGPIIDEAALVRALDERWIAGAGLDVFDEEPLAPDHPLRRAPTAVVTPHVGYVTEITLRQWYEDVIEDIAAWQAGTPIRVLT
jgi:phosphoglycerate dehydrogenase-like enzyme